MARSTFYTVSFRHVDGSEHVSRFFNFKDAAQRWVKHLLKSSYVAEVSLYRGAAGGELLDRRAA